MHLPTFIPRRAGVSSSQIDVAYTRGVRVSTLKIEAGSHNQVSTDHERIGVDVFLQGGKLPRKHGKGGPLKVTSIPGPQSWLDQQSLKQLAKQRCRPKYTESRLKPSVECQVLRGTARRSGTSEDWKRYLRHLREEKSKWKEDRVERAASSWEEYKRVTRNTQSWEGDFFRECQEPDPAQAIQDHFQKIFHSEEPGDLDSALRDLGADLDLNNPSLLQPEEIRRAVLARKPSKAVGPDEVPNEILKCLAEDTTSLRSLTAWFNDIFRSASVPDDWSVSVLKLLAKVKAPVSPAQLRPIALSSHTCKVYAAVIMNRLQQELQPSGSVQLAGKHRRACDFLWSARTLLSLLREWGSPAVVVKLDISRAFDSISRAKLATCIKQWCGHKPCETASLLALLCKSQLTIHLPWSSCSIEATRGVRQGAPESPTLFAKVIEKIVAEVSGKFGFVFTDLMADSAGYMDDLLLWQPNIPSMQAFLNDLIPRLGSYGLHIQPAKCQLLVFGNVGGTCLTIQGFKLKPLGEEDPLIVMNIPLHPVIGDIDTLYFQINKARGKLFGLRRILKDRGSGKAKLRLLETVVFGSIRWMIGAVYPSTKAQQALNAFHMYSVAFALDLKRRTGEGWVEFRQRSFRLARAFICSNEAPRWGALALTAFWQYSGHRARMIQESCPTVASMLTEFRSLQWWQLEQGRAGGIRHKRHFPFLMGVVRWREVAQNRQQWLALQQQWIDKFEVPWSSLRQPALTDL